MIYLDYSATTPVNEEVLDSFVKATKNYIGNPNSLHKLGVDAKNLIEAATKQIADILKIKPSEVVYTSGSSESNNLAIKGICLKYQNRGRHIITTELEHSSITEPLNYLKTLGFEVDFVKLDQNGVVDLEDLKKLIRKDTILVSISSVNSELGIIQPIEEIGRIIKECNRLTFFHSDMTQSFGKHKVNFDNIDLVSFSAQKFYGLKGIGGLLKKETIILEPLVHGGKSTTDFRSGTPMLGLIVSLSKALRLAYQDIDKKYAKVKELNEYLIDNLKMIEGVTINSNDKCLPHVINISIFGVKPETMLHALEEEEIYISTQTACSSTKEVSGAVKAVTRSDENASHSLRISLSHLTTKEELDIFLNVLNDKIKALKIR